jgi:uncharacterized protein
VTGGAAGPEPIFMVPQVEGIPTPVPSRLAEPYWQGCRDRELLFQRCAVCGSTPPQPAPLCPRCGSRQLSWERSSGRGRLYSWTVVWRPQHPAFSVPYAPAVVLLEEGFFMMSAIVRCAPGDLRSDLPVEVEFARVDDEITLPFFHPARRPER